VNIADQTLWKIIIDNLIDSFEIDATRHQISANEHPYLADTEFLYDLISFFFLFVSVDDVHVLSVISELLVELLGSVFALDEDQHWGFEAVVELLPKGVELTVFGSAVDEALSDGAGGGIS
jgi:hypothetical protein